VISRRRFLTGVAIALAPIGATAHAQEYKAQQAGKVYRIGLLSPTSQSPGIEAIRAGLQTLGYVEGHNLVIEYRSAEGRFDRLPDFAAELVRLHVDVIVAVVTQASLAAKNATSTIPIVMMAVGDPVGAGLVASLARPGGNVTGTSGMAVEVAGKLLELLQQVAAKIHRVSVLWNPANAVFQGQMVKATEAAARSMGIQLQMLAARDVKAIDRAFAAMTKGRAEALVVLPDPVFVAQHSRIAAFAARNRLPSVSGSRGYAEEGGLITYGPDFFELGRRTAAYVDRILKGAKPGDLPIEQAAKFELAINLKTAKALGLTIPPSLLQRADQVIE
jgi:putative ABC transport system substrate-binding protein